MRSLAPLAPVLVLAAAIGAKAASYALAPVQAEAAVAARVAALLQDAGWQPAQSAEAPLLADGTLPVAAFVRASCRMRVVVLPPGGYAAVAASAWGAKAAYYWNGALRGAPPSRADRIEALAGNLAARIGLGEPRSAFVLAMAATPDTTACARDLDWAGALR